MPLGVQFPMLVLPMALGRPAVLRAWARKLLVQIDAHLQTLTQLSGSRQQQVHETVVMFIAAVQDAPVDAPARWKHLLAAARMLWDWADKDFAGDLNPRFSVLLGKG